MESDAGQPRPFQHPLEHVQDAVRGHGASGGRWEYPFAVARFSSLLHQNVYRIRRQGQCAVGVFRFQRCLDHFAILPRDGSLNFQHAMLEVHIRPLQSQQLPPPKSGGEVEVVEFVHAAVFGLLEEGAELVGGQRFHLLVLHLWQGAALRWILAHQLLLHSEVVRRADHLMDVSHGFRCQTFRLFLGLDAVYPATVQQMLVEPLQVQRSEICQRDAADLWLDVVFEEALAGLERGRSEFHLGVVLHPDLQPTPHRVGLGPSVVDTDVFLDGFFQFFFYFRLRLAEDVFDDGLPCFGISASRVPALPSTVLSFADVPFPVRSSFRHGISPFRQRTIP